MEKLCQNQVIQGLSCSEVIFRVIGFLPIAKRKSVCGYSYLEDNKLPAWDALLEKAPPVPAEDDPSLDPIRHWLCLASRQLTTLATGLFSVNWMHRPEPSWTRRLDRLLRGSLPPGPAALSSCQSRRYSAPFCCAGSDCHCLSRQPTAGAAGAMTNMAITLQPVRGEAS